MVKLHKIQPADPRNFSQNCITAIKNTDKTCLKVLKWDYI